MRDWVLFYIAAVEDPSLRRREEITIQRPLSRSMEMNEVRPGDLLVFSDSTHDVGPVFLISIVDCPTVQISNMVSSKSIKSSGKILSLADYVITWRPLTNLELLTMCETGAASGITDQLPLRVDLMVRGWSNSSRPNVAGHYCCSPCRSPHHRD